jgi:hypothetical protein
LPIFCAPRKSLIFDYAEFGRGTNLAHMPDDPIGGFGQETRIGRHGSIRNSVVDFTCRIDTRSALV